MAQFNYQPPPQQSYPYEASGLPLATQSGNQSQPSGSWHNHHHQRQQPITPQYPPSQTHYAPQGHTGHHQSSSNQSSSSHLSQQQPHATANARFYPPQQHSTPQPTQPTSSQQSETFYGFVKDEIDAKILIEACVNKELPLIPDIPCGGEGASSGKVYVFCESSSQILKMRWRDGLHWSSSRISGNFLLYREVESTDVPTNVQRAQEKEATALFTTSSLRPYTRLIPNGLAKRTISLTGSDGLRYRVINYFYPKFVEHHYAPPNLRQIFDPNARGMLQMPSQVPHLQKYATKSNSTAGAATSSNIQSDSMETLAPQSHAMRNSPQNTAIRLPPLENNRSQTSQYLPVRPDVQQQHFHQHQPLYPGIRELSKAFEGNPNWAESPVILAPLLLQGVKWGDR
ncbi:Gti1/Pac2 family-domain-containing protein [Obelidium mucronatum]|nr:Gti1/Pac2 family-domain-containing protein [Obelidium mucronatum]